ncbi:MAG TPA: hypothetical protein GX701_05700 [Clostridiales bacterium]|jgi:NAD dependent epimerase/dehydratase family enzyme|nr:hypothetical protein [Clostridiales bacterium]
MIRGAARHVIVVKNPDKRYFEQAIFIVKTSAFTKYGKSEEEIMKAARAAANDFLRQQKKTETITYFL